MDTSWAVSLGQQPQQSSGSAAKVASRDTDEARLAVRKGPAAQERWHQEQRLTARGADSDRRGGRRKHAGA